VKIIIYPLWQVGRFIFWYISLLFVDPETGLTTQEVDERREYFGFNELEENEESVLLKFLSYFWGPMPIMIWVAILVEFINEEWPDFGVLLFLQIVNGF